MPKIRLGDLLKVMNENQKIKVKGFYSKMSYGMEDVSDNYLRRYVLEIKTIFENYDAVIEIYFEDEIH